METPQPIALLDNRRRILFAQIAQWIRGAFALVVLVSYGVQYRLLSRLQLGQPVSTEAAVANDWRVNFLSSVQLVVALLAFIALVQWFYRAYQNAHRLPNAKPEYSAGMAIWSWLVPFVNLWLPYKIMLELGHYLGGFTNPRNAIISSKWDYLVVSWWVLNIGVIILSRVNISPAMIPSGTSTLNDLLRATRILMGTQLVTMLSAMATLAILRVIAPHEQALSAFQVTPPTPEADVMTALK